MDFRDIMVNLGLRVGDQRNTDGSLCNLRAGKTGEGVFTQAHARLYEAASRRKIFYNHAPAVAMSAPATAAIGNIIWNPPDSGVLLAIGKISAAYLVTDADALTINLCYSAQATLPTTTSGSTQGCGYIGAVGTSQGIAKGYGIATITTAATPICHLFRLTAGIQTVGVETSWVDLEGSVIIPPGFLLSLHSIAAAGAAGVTSTVWWEEVPIL